MLYRRRDIKRLFAYSSIEHMGIITFAFGMGGPLANFAGLLHMTMHSLDQVGDLLRRRPYRAGQGHAEACGHPRPHQQPSDARLGLRGRGVLAIAGLPPLGIFMSEFLIVTSTLARQPLLAIPLVLGICSSAFGALILRLQGVAFGEVPTRGHRADQGVAAPGVRASRPGRDRRPLPAAAAGRLVPARRPAAWAEP